MNQPAVGIVHNEEGLKLGFLGYFDGLQTFELFHELISSANATNRLALDFSSASPVKPLEVYYLLAELSADPRFNEIAISMEGLQCQSPNERV